MGPYAWESSTTLSERCMRRTKKNTEKQVPYERVIPTGKENQPEHVTQGTDLQQAQQDYQKQPRSDEVLSMIKADAAMCLRLPPVGATAGRVLQHAANIFEELQRKHKPMIFKFGLTHSPPFRWHNETFGYKHSLDKFEHMTIVFAAGNPFAPAFVEASLIREFGSTMAAITTGSLTTCVLLLCFLVVAVGLF